VDMVNSVHPHPQQAGPKTSSQLKVREKGGGDHQSTYTFYCCLWLGLRQVSSSARQRDGRGRLSNGLYIAGSLLALGALFGSLSAVYLMDAVGRKASLLAFSVMSLFIGEFSPHVNFYR
jgi:hypothetical protein